MSVKVGIVGAIVSARSGGRRHGRDEDDRDDRRRDDDHPRPRITFWGFVAAPIGPRRCT